MWKTRNDLLFQNICLSPDVCCTKATDMLQEYHKVWISPSTSPSARTNAKWEPPNQGVLKVNFDAAINLDYGRVGIGIVTRDMQGKVVFASSKTLLQRWGPEMGEAAAALVAIKVAKEQGWKDIVLEGDACTIIRALKGSQQRGSHVQLMVEDARASRSRKKHKLINGAEGENKAKGNKKGLSNSSGMDSKDLTALKQHVARKCLFANLALKFYKKKTGQNHELVDPGYKGQGFLKEGLVCHINFEAKNKDDPNASEFRAPIFR
ncbi:hypothetical protein SOVF_039330 [Spinacia oleracea]|nr:hypothetical protein SOVF_039330 [Spinacia oleracea]